MASARTLTANELGGARFQRALAADLWPVEVRLHRLPHDADTTVYTLHTAAADPVPFRHTARNDLRATLRVSPGALQYEVLRDGTLVSTGGVDVRPPQAPLQRSQMATPLAVRPPSGAVQLTRDETAAHRATHSARGLTLSQTTAVTQGSADAEREHDSASLNGAARSQAAKQQLWPVRFVYEEVTWMAREVDVVAAESGTLLAALKREDSRFVGIASVVPGTLRFRFRVRPHEGLTANTAPFTRLGWDDAAMRHTWGLVTWPLEVRVADLAAGTDGPGAALVEVSETAAMAAVEARRKRAQELADRTREMLDDDDDDDEMEDEDDDDELDERSEADESERVDGMVRNMVKTVEAYDLTSRAETPRSKSGGAVGRVPIAATTKSEDADTPRSATSMCTPVAMDSDATMSRVPSTTKSEDADTPRSATSTYTPVEMGRDGAVSRVPSAATTKSEDMDTPRSGTSTCAPVEMGSDGAVSRVPSATMTKSEDVDTLRSGTSTCAPVKMDKANGGDRQHHGVSCMVFGIAMFVLGSGMTLWLGSRAAFAREDDEWNELDEEPGSRSGDALLRHQRGASF